MNNPLINPGLGTFFWMLVSFGILVFILGKWGWPMLLKSLKKREEAIAESLNAAEKARIEMSKLVAHNEELLRQAQREREEMLSSARLASEEIKEKARIDATEEANRIVENARKNIDEVMGGTMIDYSIVSVNETTLMDVFEHLAKASKQDDKPEYEG